MNILASMTALKKKKQELEAKFEEFINNMSSNAQKINDRQYRIVLVKSSTGGRMGRPRYKTVDEVISELSRQGADETYINRLRELKSIEINLLSIAGDIATAYKNKDTDLDFVDDIVNGINKALS